MLYLTSEDLVGAWYGPWAAPTTAGPITGLTDVLKYIDTIEFVASAPVLELTNHGNPAQQARAGRQNYRLTLVGHHLPEDASFPFYEADLSETRKLVVISYKVPGASQNDNEIGTYGLSFGCFQLNNPGISGHASAGSYPTFGSIVFGGDGQHPVYH